MAIMSVNSQRLVLLLICGLGLAGCSSGPEYGEVHGVVTLDDEPLVGASVTFFPEFPDGHPSYGTTDNSGRFILSASDQLVGAVVGTYTVRITTFNAGKPDVDPPMPFVQERVPTKYNIKSTLVREVKPGMNEMNFALDSQGEIMAIDEDFCY